MILSGLQGNRSTNHAGRYHSRTIPSMKRYQLLPNKHRIYCKAGKPYKPKFNPHKGSFQGSSKGSFECSSKGSFKCSSKGSFKCSSKGSFTGNFHKNSPRSLMEIGEVSPYRADTFCIGNRTVASRQSISRQIETPNGPQTLKSKDPKYSSRDEYIYIYIYISLSLSLSLSFSSLFF